MRFSLLVYSAEAAEANVPPEVIEQFQTAFDDYAKSLESAGVLISADVLQPVAATTSLTAAEGTPMVTGGPSTDVAQKLNGIFVVDVPDRATAIEWAATCPGARYGTVEIRPSAVTFLDGRWT